MKKRIMTIVLLISFSLNSYAGFLSGLFGGGGGGSAALLPVEIANMNANILSKLELIAQTMQDIEEMKRQAERWKYLFQRLDPSTMTGQITDFYDFVSRYRQYTNRVANTFNDISGFEDQFYRTFKKAGQIVNVDMNDLNKSREKTKDMVQDSVYDSMNLVVDMTGSKNRDEDYAQQQEEWMNRVSAGEVDPNKIAQSTLEAIIQTNNILMDLKSINISMLNQLSMIQQGKIEDKKINEEKVRRLIEENQKKIEKKKTSTESSGEIKL